MWDGSSARKRRPGLRRALGAWLAAVLFSAAE
jgi:hypothetical protein